jgi:hypothetical protein
MTLPQYHFKRLDSDAQGEPPQQYFIDLATPSSDKIAFSAPLKSPL